MFDTHCHLNFKRFNNNIKDVIDRAKKAGVTGIIVPGTDVETSQKAVEIAAQYEGVYAAVGIHPHHVFSVIPNLFRDLNKKKANLQLDKQVQHHDVKHIERLLSHPKVVAIGEVGFDNHQYSITKYEQYPVDEKFIEAQKRLLIEQIKFAIKYNKSLILHNWEAKKELLSLLEKHWDSKLEKKTVFHCCEPDLELLEFARKHGIFIGVDGDVTYSPQKAYFIQKVPLEMLVAETDSPYLLPEPLRSQKLFPNEPKNIVIIVEYISKIKGFSIATLNDVMIKNSKKLFDIS